MNIVNTWQFNLTGYLIFVVIFFQYYKLAVKNAKNNAAATIILQIIGALSIIPFIPLNDLKLSSSPKIYLLIFLASVFYAVNNHLQTVVRKNLQVSIFSILNQLTTVFLIFLSLVFLKQQISGEKIIGAGTIIAGNIWLLYGSGRFTLCRYTLLAILSSLAAAAGILISIGLTSNFNLPLYIMLTFFIPAVLIKIGSGIKFSDIRQEFFSANKKVYFLAGISWALTILLSLRAFQFGQVATVAPIQSLSILLNILVATLFLGEKSLKIRKLSAGLIVICGVCLQFIKI